MKAMLDWMYEFIGFFKYYFRAMLPTLGVLVLYGASKVYLAEEHLRSDVLLYQFLPGTFVILVLLPGAVAIVLQIAGRSSR